MKKYYVKLDNDELGFDEIDEVLAIEIKTKYTGVILYPEDVKIIEIKEMEDLLTNKEKE